MIIPKKLKIGAHIFTVKFSTDMEDCGKCSRDKGEIKLASSMVRSHQEATLFHEILHAINNELPEATVDSLAEQLYQVLNDNNLLR